MSNVSLCKITTPPRLKLWLGRKPLPLTLELGAVAMLSAVGLYGQAVVRGSDATALPRRSAPAERLEFDVASIRPNQSGGPPHSNFPINSGTMYDQTQGIFSSTNRPLIDYISFAYKMTDSQRQDLMQQLPAWALSDGFDILAKSENHDPTKDQMRLMMQSLLADRFKLAVHTETRRVSIFALVLAKPGTVGPQLKSHPAEKSCAAPDPAAPAPDAPSAPLAMLVGVWPTGCGGINRERSALSPGVIRAGGRNLSMESFASSMTGLGNLDRPVMDQTGLTGNFDFVLEFAPENTTGENTGGPAFVEALKEQLGLKLGSHKAAADYIHIDHVERPTAN